MRQRSFIILAVALGFLLIGSIAVYAYDSSRDDTISEGVKAGGIDIGGMETAEARAKVQRELTARLNRSLWATYHDERFKLSTKSARLKIDAKGMIDEALSKSREGNILARTARNLTGGEVKAEIPVAATYSKAAVGRLVKRVQEGLNRPAQDAQVDVSSGSLARVKAEKGRTVRAEILREDVESTLALPDADRNVPISVAATMPKVTTRDLVKKYPTIIAINRSAYQLVLYKRLKLVKTYAIAVGQAGLETPSGEYTVADKQVNPTWFVPNSAWAGSLAGRVIPPGPSNPLKARWIGIIGGAGIHGTIETGSLGTSASHGCIRMAIPDVIELYDRTPYGSKIFVN